MSDYDNPKPFVNDTCPNCGQSVKPHEDYIYDEKAEEYRHCLIWECECDKFGSCWLDDIA